MVSFVQTRVYTVCSSKVYIVYLVYTIICKLSPSQVQTMIILNCKLGADLRLFRTENPRSRAWLTQCSFNIAIGLPERSNC